MNFRKIAAASAGRLLLRYFTENTPEPIHPAPVDAAGRSLEEGGRLTAYYTGRDSRAAWRPDMPAILAKAIGIDPTQMPRDAELTRLFEARRADNGEAWSAHPRKLSGVDLVFSPDKSVTLAAEFAPTPSEAALIWNAIDRAADRAMRYVAQEVGRARRGKGGEDGADPGAVGWVSFRHHTARPTLQVQDGAEGQTYLFDAPVAGDPHAHIHHFLMNIVATADGRIGSLDLRALTDSRIKEFGAYFQAVLADELRRLGIRVSYNENEQAVVIDSVPAEIGRVFSKRDRQILRKARAFAERQGLSWDDLSADRKLDIVEEASAEGRLGKMKADERRIWREQADALGWKHESVIGETTYAKRTDEDRFEESYRFAARHVAEEFRTAAVIDHEKLGLHAARGLIGAGIAGGPADIKRVVELIETRGIQVGGEHVSLVVGVFDDKVRVSHTRQIRIEERLQSLAHEMARDKSGALGTGALRRAMGQSKVRFSADQRAAIYALGQGGRLTLLTGAAGVGKTTILEPVVAAWKADTRFDAKGREVIGTALAWRQADALRDAGIDRAYALSPLLAMIERGDITVSRNTVLVIDEVSQVGPRPLLKLLELQARKGMTIKMLGDREQAQAIEAGDSIELLRRALPPEALPVLLTTVRQAIQRGREIAALFREGQAKDALEMKRADGHARLLGGDRDQVVGQIADLYIERRDVLLASGCKRGITVSAPTNEDAADISQAIRTRLKQRGEIAGPESVYRAVDQNGREYDLALAAGDRVRLYRRTWGFEGGTERQIGNNGDVVEVLGQGTSGMRVRTAKGEVAEIDWQRLADKETGRLLLGLGYALTIDAAQGLTSDEHINALPRGTSGVTGFTSYVAESRARGTTWTLISEGALHEAEKHRQAIGEATPITQDMLWARAATDMSEKPYKALGIDLLNAARHDRERAVDAFIGAHHAMEAATQRDPGWGKGAAQRIKALAVNEQLARHLPSLDTAIRENARILRDIRSAAEVHQHLKALRAEASAAGQWLAAVLRPVPAHKPSNGPAP